MRWVIASLVALAACMAFAVYLGLHVPDGKLYGLFFLAIGALNLLFYKRIGREFYAKTQSRRPLVANIWARLGEKGLQVLYLGVGIIFATAGCVVIIADVR